MESVQTRLETYLSVQVSHGSSGCDDGSNEDEDSRRSFVAVEEGGEIVKDEERRSNGLECSVEADLELGLPEKAVHLSHSERDCRICHMSLDAANLGSGVPIELGCSCKSDLAAVHKNCAETWFKIKGNKICEVCGSIAGNVVGTFEVESEERLNESHGVVNQALRTSGPRFREARSLWQGHRFLSFLLACMVFAFLISWLFHFKFPST